MIYKPSNGFSDLGNLRAYGTRLSPIGEIYDQPQRKCDAGQESPVYQTLKSSAFIPAHRAGHSAAFP